MDIDSIPRKPNELYIDEMQGRTVVYNPLSEKGILVLESGAGAILEFCDGFRNISSISKRMSIAYAGTLKIIKQLADYEVLDVSGYKPPALPKKINSMFVWVTTTSTCTLACRYCYRSENKKKMKKVTARKLVDNVFESIRIHKEIPGLSLVIAGGEPFTNLDVVKEILEYSRDKIRILNMEQKRIMTVIISNGTILNPEIISLLKNYKPQLCISIDGLGGMNRNRRFLNGSSSTGLILRNIDKLQKEGVRLSVLITITKENLNGLVAFTKYLLGRDIGFSFSPVRNLKMTADLIKYSDKTIAILNECYDLMEEMLLKRPRFIQHKFGSVSLGIHNFRGCTLGKYSVAISPDGEIYLCQMDVGNSDALTTIKEKDILGKLWKQTVYPELNKYKSVDDYDRCSVCRWRYQCGGGCSLLTKMFTNRVNQPSPYCALYQAIIPRLIRINALYFIAWQARTPLIREKN